MKKILPLFFIVIIVSAFFWQFLLKGLLPIPADTIIGLYHPFRDLYAKEYPRGIPFKNSLITDPVRQQYPWRKLAVSLEKDLQLPLWNPYSLSGAPLLANFQSSVFYPLNILFFLLPFSFGWSLLVMLQPLLAGVFLYLYLENLKLDKFSAFFGSLVFSLSGFFVAWLEWGTVLNTALWLPLILLSIDKLVLSKEKQLSIWNVIFILSLVFSFFAGHLQTFFYLFLISFIYLFVKWWQYGKSKKLLALFTIQYSVFTIITSVQWIPTLQFILLSARNVDQSPLLSPGWFIPWQNLIQFVAPDFFGNPATLNYWGIWNYGEFIGYIGILPLILVFFAMFFRRDKKTLFFGSIFFLSLIFALPTYIAKIPFLLRIPFIDTAQPTRLIFLSDFSLAVLSAFGLDYLLRTKNKKGIFYPLIFIGVIILASWIFVLLGGRIDKSLIVNLSVSKHNLMLPTFTFLLSAIIFLILVLFKKLSKHAVLMICIIIVALVVSDLFRFGWKFTPFTDRKYLFPATPAINFLQKQKGVFRIMATDSGILPPDFSVIYKIQSIEGYDPLYLQRYGELIAASERGKPDIAPPFGFNRIITPHNFDSNIINLLGVKFILSLSDINKKGYRKVYQEGQTQIYKNMNVFPRAFFVKNLDLADNKQSAMNDVFKSNISLKDTAIVEGLNIKKNINVGSVKIVNYSENKVLLETNNNSNGFLVLTDTFYPTWHATVDGRQTRIYKTDFNFRGIAVSKGKHLIEFYDTLF